jgi:hypothetical protein
VNDDMLTSQSLFIEPPRRDRITAISGVVQRRPIVLVLGMHRSGTSLCSHLLSALGVDMADKIPGPKGTSPQPDNPRGHWERWEIVEFHDRILGLFNRDYLGRFHDFALPVAWWADPRVAQIRREIVAFLEQRMGDSYFGFKDPRTVRLMPVWHQIFNELKLAPKVVLCLRNPVQVARSLHAREGLDPANGEYRWLVHMIDFFRYASHFDFCAVEYEEWFDNPAANLEKLRKFLDLPWQQSESDLALLLSDIIDPSARHDDPGRREASQPLVRTLYKLAGRSGQDGTRDQIAYIVSQFVSFQQLQRPLLQAFEGVAKTAAKYPEVEQEAMALRAAVGERDAVIEAADARAAGAEGRLADLKATLAERETALAEHSRRADELDAALQAAQAEIAARDAALRHAEHEARERGPAALATQNEIAGLRAALEQAEQEGQKHLAATEVLQAEVGAQSAAAEVLQAEIGSLRQALAQGDRAAQERGVAAEALQTEVALLRETLAKAQREAQERAAEIGALQEALTAARQVGKAAIAAFRMDAMVPARPEEPRGWRRAVMRFLGTWTNFSSLN